MPNINEKIELELKKLEQLKRQKREQDIREKNKKKKLDDKRCFIIGEMVCEYFPEVLRFQPCRSITDNNVEFAAFKNFLTLLAEDKQYIAQLIKKANKKNLSE